MGLYRACCMSRIKEMPDSHRARSSTRKGSLMGMGAVALVLSVGILTIAFAAVLVFMSHQERQKNASSTVHEPVRDLSSSLSGLSLPIATPQATDSRTESPSISHDFFNTNTCSIKANPYDSSIRALYCSLVPSQDGTLYARLPNVYENTEGQVINGDLYITRSSENSGSQLLTARQDQLWLYDYVEPAREIFGLSGDSTSSITAVFVSPDEEHVAMILTSDSTSDNRIDSSSVLEVTNTDGTVQKAFSPKQLHVTFGCNCSASILGWGNEDLWLTLAKGSDGSIPIDFLRIDTKDWSVV